MKILLISPTQSGIGGIAQHVQGLKNFLENKGINVQIISSENTFTIPIKGLKNPSFMISSSLKAKFKKNNDIVESETDEPKTVIESAIQEAEEKVDDFVKASVEVTSEMYPEMKDNDDFTSIVNQKHYDRIQGLLEDAKEKGADIVEINPSNEDFSQQPHHKIPPTILLNPSEDMKIMQEEIFGPVLPVKTYKDVSEPVEYINSKDRPLGLYYFGEDNTEKDYVLDNTTSGGVTVNDVISHIQMEDLPFGGVGPSGMGSYHGYDGFKEFSHAKAVYKQTKFNLMKLAGLVPPYKKKEEKNNTA